MRFQTLMFPRRRRKVASLVLARVRARLAMLASPRGQRRASGGPRGLIVPSRAASVWMHAPVPRFFIATSFWCGTTAVVGDILPRPFPVWASRHNSQAGPSGRPRREKRKRKERREGRTRWRRRRHARPSERLPSMTIRPAKTPFCPFDLSMSRRCSVRNERATGSTRQADPTYYTGGSQMLQGPTAKAVLVVVALKAEAEFHSASTGSDLSSNVAGH